MIHNYEIYILVTLTVAVDVSVIELISAVQVYSPACEVLRELNISSLEYVGPDPVTAPTVKSPSLEMLVPLGPLQVMEGVSVSPVRVTVHVSE